MNGEEQVTTQVKQQKFATPSYTLDAPSGYLCKEIGKIGIANSPFPENFCFPNCGTYDGCTQLACCILNFWQFWHDSLLVLEQVYAFFCVEYASIIWNYTIHLEVG